MSSRYPWIRYVFLFFGLSVLIAYWPASSTVANTVLYDSVSFMGAVATILGIRLYRPSRPLPWYVLAAGMFLTTVGDVTYGYYEIVLEVYAPFPSMADAFYLAGSATLAGGTALMVRTRVTGTDTGSVIDAAIIAVGVGVVSWIYLMVPYVEDESMTVFARLVSIAYPLVDIMMIALAARLLFSSGARPRSYYFLCLGPVLYFFSDVFYAALALNGTYYGGHPIDYGWMLAYLCWGFAALHPSMRDVSEITPDSRPTLTKGRIVLLAAASLLAPAVLLVEYLGGGHFEEIVPAAVLGTVVLFLLSLARMNGLSEDLHRRKGEERLSALVRNATDAVMILDSVGKFRYLSPSYERILGHNPRALMGTDSFDLVHSDDAAHVGSYFSEVLASPGVAPPIELRIRHADGSWRPMESVANNLLDDPNVGGVVVNSRDVTERKHAEEMLAHQAFHDSLTGLPNRALFMNRLEHALTRADRQAQHVAVLFLDLDRFKVVNDSMGHEAGDELLVSVSRRLETCLRPQDTVARLGGDEFTILLEDVEGADEAVQIAKRMSKALQEPVGVREQDVFTSPSIGIALSAGEGTATDLLRAADIAMYRAKSKGRDGCEIFDQSMNAYALRRMELEGALRRAIERGELKVYYQPTVEFRNGEAIGMEALVRWEHPEHGLVSPAQFIPLAEETGLILPLGRWVLEEACRQAREWHKRIPHKGHPPSISVNLSAKQFQQPGIVREVAEVLRISGLTPGSLILEITESAMMEDEQSNIATLQRLKDLGVRLAVDDFGTGYSSLGYLKRLPVDILKIDKSFVAGLEHDLEDTAIARAVIDLAGALGLDTVAEGVETAGQLSLLRALGCELGQGYYFAKPLPAGKAQEILIPSRSSARR